LLGKFNHIFDTGLLKKFYMNRSPEEKTEDVFKQASSYFTMWIGVVVCALCAVSFFISTESLVKWVVETEIEHRGDDSDASVLIYNAKMLMLDLGLWLKNLPTVAKIAGVIVGGILWFSNADHD